MISILRNLCSFAAWEYYFQSSLNAFFAQYAKCKQEWRSLKNSIVNLTREVSNTNKIEKKLFAPSRNPSSSAPRLVNLQAALCNSIILVEKVSEIL
jgi:hypothetical protein